MKIKVSLKLNQAAIKKIEEGMIKALPYTMEAMKTEINNMQVVPKDTGNLEESAKTGVEGNKGFISYNTPYARRLYFHPEYNFRQDKNPNAQGRWMDSFIHGPKKEWLSKTYGEFLKRLSGGVIK
ncbi:MAG: minor capsid protein [Tissierellales bacterium]